MAAKFQQYSVPAGARGHQLVLQTGERQILRKCRFVAGGRRDVLTQRITGNTGTPDITFNPPARPFEVTVHFARNAIAETDSADFVIIVDNAGADDIMIEYGIVYDP